MLLCQVFPYILPRIQRWSPKKQLAWIGGFNIVQIVAFVVLMALDLGIMGPGQNGYWLARANPLSR